MKKSRYGLSAQDKQAKKNVKHMPDQEIDFSDIPESTDAELKKAQRVGRPPRGSEAKQLIAIRIDPQVLKRIKSIAKKEKKPYQTFIHEILEKQSS